MNQQSRRPSLQNRIARVLLCLVFVNAVVGKLTGFAGVAGAIAAKGLPLAPLLGLQPFAVKARYSAEETPLPADRTLLLRDIAALANALDARLTR